IPLAGARLPVLAYRCSLTGARLPALAYRRSLTGSWLSAYHVGRSCVRDRRDRRDRDNGAKRHERRKDCVPNARISLAIFDIREVTHRERSLYKSEANTCQIVTAGYLDFAQAATCRGKCRRH